MQDLVERSSPLTLKGASSQSGVQRWKLLRRFTLCFGCSTTRLEIDDQAETVEYKRSVNARHLRKQQELSLEAQPRALNHQMQALENGDPLSEWESWFSGEDTVYYKPPELKTDEQYAVIHTQFQKDQERVRPSRSVDLAARTTQIWRVNHLEEDYQLMSKGEREELCLRAFAASEFDRPPTVMFSRSFWKLLDKFRPDIPSSQTNNHVQKTSTPSTNALSFTGPSCSSIQ